MFDYDTGRLKGGSGRSKESLLDLVGVSYKQVTNYWVPTYLARLHKKVMYSSWR